MRATPEYGVKEMTVAPRAVAGVRARVQMGRVPQEFGRYLDQVYALARTGAVKLDGQNVFIYREATGNELVVDFCVGLASPFSGSGQVQALQTPGGVAAMTRHRGDYGGITNANNAIREWCQQHQRVRAGPSWEVYGHWNDDPALLWTDIYYLLK